MSKSLRDERLRIHPLTLKEACQLVARWHRHLKRPTGGLLAIGVALENATEPCGCVIVGRPSARMLDDGWTAEVTRCCTNGYRNAPSMLYRAAWRAVRAMGYRRLVTYTLPEEGGASLRAAGFKLIGEAGGGKWDREQRPRVDDHPQQKKLRWELSEAARARAGS